MWGLLCAFVQLSSALPWVSEPPVDLSKYLTEQSYLEVSTEMTTGQYQMTDCISTGDTHSKLFIDIATDRRNDWVDVMGVREWIVAEGPTDGSTTLWKVQATQKIWQNCYKGDQSVTVVKDMALQCGNFFALVASPKGVHNCCSDAYKSDASLPWVNPAIPIQPRFFLKGKSNAGVTYDGSDYYNDAIVASGKTIEFPDGSIKITHETCKPNKCLPRGTHWPMLRIEFFCSSTVTVVEVIQHADWSCGNFISASVQVARDAPAAPIRCGTEPSSTDPSKRGTLTKGYCGCWNDFQAVKTQFNLCAASPTRPFFKEQACLQPYFAPTQTNSLFALFEYWGSKLTSLTSERKYDSQFALVASNTVPDLEVLKQLYARNVAVCKATLDQALGTPFNYDLANDDLRVKFALIQVGFCATDTSHDMPWSVETMKSAFCSGVEFSIEQERKDIFCAYQKLDGECPAVNPSLNFGTFLANARTDADAEQIKSINSHLFEMTKEVTSSLANIDFWYTETCLSKIKDTTGLVQTDCTNHQFVDTKAVYCASSPPVINGVWDGTCAPGKKDGETCVVKCASKPGVEVFPAGAAASSTYTCAVSASSGKISVRWDSTNKLQCCTGACNGPAEYREGRCENGVFLCAYCPLGQIRSNNQCVWKGCPANAEGATNCACKRGYQGTLSWEVKTGSWVGQCTLASCPANAAGAPSCQCNAGFSGILNWNDQKWEGTCSACSLGVSFSNMTGLSQCFPCSTCAATQVVAQSCSLTTDTICVCAPGNSGSPCQSCPAGTYTDTTGQTSCKVCTKCNSEYEVVSRLCTSTADTQCLCKVAGAAGNCYDIVLSKTLRY